MSDFFGLLAGDHQLSLALFERALETPRAQEKRRNETSSSTSSTIPATSNSM